MRVMRKKKPRTPPRIGAQGMSLPLGVELSGVLRGDIEGMVEGSVDVDVAVTDTVLVKTGKVDVPSVVAERVATVEVWVAVRGVGVTVSSTTGCMNKSNRKQGVFIAVVSTARAPTSPSSSSMTTLATSVGTVGPSVGRTGLPVGSNGSVVSGGGAMVVGVITTSSVVLEGGGDVSTVVAVVVISVDVGTTSVMEVMVGVPVSVGVEKVVSEGEGSMEELIVVEDAGGCELVGTEVESVIDGEGSMRVEDTVVDGETVVEMISVVDGGINVPDE
ncbi:hypothetical protein HK102_011787, partial [Quaeritorhiza haematococci]